MIVLDKESNMRTKLIAIAIAAAFPIAAIGAGAWRSVGKHGRCRERTAHRLSGRRVLSVLKRADLDPARFVAVDE
jgi:hypothetical protein